MFGDINPAKVKEILRDSMERQISNEPFLVRAARSPIEKLMAWAFVGRGMWTGKVDHLMFNEGDDDHTLDGLRRECVVRAGTTPECKILVGSQIRCDQYVVDFGAAISMFNKPPLIVVIECDGHEFHTSKDQFTRDKAKDRHLLQKGFRVMRFSGSEIYVDAGARAQEVIDFMFSAHLDAVPGTIHYDSFDLHYLAKFEAKNGIATPDWMLNQVSPF